MKFKYLIILLAAGFFSCEKPTYQLDVSIDDHTSNFVHSWELTTVTQIDQKAGPGKLKSLDISAAALKNTSALTFTQGNYTASGVITELFGDSGTWSLDNAEFPTTIRISNAEGDSEVPLGRSVLEFSDELHLQNDVYNCIDGTLVTSYVYVLNKK